VPLRCDEAEWDPDQGCEEHRSERKLDRRGEPLANLLGDRAAGRDAGAEVTVGDRLEVAPVLDVERIVEAVLVTDLRDRLLGCTLAQERLGRRSGERPDPEEDEQREPEENRDQQQ
jgi:hypothetical protein